MAEAKDSKSKKSDEKEPEVRLSGTGRPLGPHEGDPKAAAEANLTDQVRKQRQADAQLAKVEDEDPLVAPVVEDVFDAPATADAPAYEGGDAKK